MRMLNTFLREMMTQSNTDFSLGILSFKHPKMEDEKSTKFLPVNGF